MTNRTTETSPRTIARIAGFLYLLVIPLGIFGALFVDATLIVPGDAAATAANIKASELLFRLGIVSNLLASIVMLFVANVLYRLLKPVGRNVASLMVILVVAGASIAILNALNQFAALLLLGGADFLSVFTTDQL